MAHLGTHQAAQPHSTASGKQKLHMNLAMKEGARKKVQHSRVLKFKPQFCSLTVLACSLLSWKQAGYGLSDKMRV